MTLRLHFVGNLAAWSWNTGQIDQGNAIALPLDIFPELETP
jgi:hypothetical protein